MPFRDVVGHVRLIDLLARSVSGGTLPPSLLFAGPSGVGKQLTAIAVAQALNCTDGSRFTVRDFADACGACAACSRIARGVHPDVLLVSPNENGNIKIEPIRDAIDRAQYRPFEGRKRVVIIDDADALVSQAQNALLKTLEEPAASSVFILVTARPDMLLPTVLSRCPQLRFRPLPVEDIVTGLIARDRSEAEARAVAATADGSLGQALQTSAGDLVESRERARIVLEEAARERDPARRIEAAQNLLAKPTGGITERQQLATHLRAMAVLLRDVEVVATGADDGALANADLRPVLERLTNAYRGARGTQAFAAIDRALFALERNAGVKLVADWLVLQL
jgi:DNA polymerase-3 subunit delta'